VNMLERIGAGAIHRLADVGELSLQFWAGLRASPHVLPVVGKRGRWHAAIQQMSAIGVDALPMIAIVTSCAGFIFAMQSGAELRRFGAMQLVIDILAIGFTRELGPLLTAIVVRKFVAAIIVVPCLTIMSNVFGISAGAVFMYLSTTMTLPMYARYVANAIVLRDVFTGLVKSVAFAVIIVHVGCAEGFKVRGGPDAVGRSTTSAVVKSTFLVILADLFFTAVFYLMQAG
jgi:phospholipid/cholesterol/gamma-HCH transport system permease protein